MNAFARILGSTVCVFPIALLAGCGGKTHTSAALRTPEPRKLIGLRSDATDWRLVATLIDRDRLRSWRKTWIDALAKVGTSPDAAIVKADPLLFDPDRALLDPTPPPGAYRCRVFKLGAHGTAMREVTTTPAVDCHVARQGDVSSIYKVSGAQRPVGVLFTESVSRAIFLGTLVLGDETKPLNYGQDVNRDLAGYIERIGDKRWRLVLPRPRFESILDVVEIVPA